LEFQAQAGLDSVGRLMVLVESGNDRIAKEAASRDRPTGAEAERRSVWIRSTQQIRKGDGGKFGALAKRTGAWWNWLASSWGRPGYRSGSSAAGRYRHASNGMGMMPWKTPPPPRKTMLYLVPKL